MGVVAGKPRRSAEICNPAPKLRFLPLQPLGIGFL